MKRDVLIGVGLAAALAVAATVRPPRAAPAFSPGVMVSHVPSNVMVSGAPRRGAETNHRRYRHRGNKTFGHGTGRSRHRAKSPRRHVELVDLNHADAAELARVPGLTQELARRIVAFRGLVGPFENLDDLSDLDGLSESRLAALGRYLVVR